jgi:hypothetical protein
MRLFLGSISRYYFVQFNLKYHKYFQACSVELILQESCTDASGSVIVYAPVDVPAINIVRTRGQLCIKTHTKNKKTHTHTHKNAYKKQKRIYKKQKRLPLCNLARPRNLSATSHGPATSLQPLCNLSRPRNHTRPRSQTRTKRKTSQQPNTDKAHTTKNGQPLCNLARTTNKFLTIVHRCVAII